MAKKKLSPSLTVRMPAVAGRFYNDDRGELEKDVLRFLNEAKVNAVNPKALIAPHAGLMYSGPIAGSAYATLSSVKNKIRTVVLLGPSHFLAFDGIAAPTQAFFRTPLGDIPIAQEKLLSLKKFSSFVFLDAAHDREHGLEVQLPFLQKTLTDFEILPLVVGSARGVEVCDILRFLDSEETLLIVSSDLSHFLDYASAKKIDATTAKAITNLETTALHANQACGHLPIDGIRLYAKEKGLRVTQLDLRNSGDTAGSKDSVVGYGAFAFY